MGFYELMMLQVLIDWIPPLLLQYPENQHEHSYWSSRRTHLKLRGSRKLTYLRMLAGLMQSFSFSLLL